MNSIRSLADLTAVLQARTTKVAATTPSDPADQGTVGIPKDPSGTASAQNLPPYGSNARVTSNCPVPGTTDKPSIEYPNMNDKAASVLASLKTLRGNLGKPATKAAETNDAAAADATQPPGDTGVPDKAKAPTPSVKSDSKGELPPDGENKTDSPEKGEKVAGGEFTTQEAQELHMKLASLLLESEDGRAFAGQLLEKQAGVEAARDIMQVALFAHQQMNEAAQAEASGAAQADRLWSAMSDQDRAKTASLTEALATIVDALETPEEKQAALAGAFEAAQLMEFPKIAAALGLDGAAAAPVGGAGGSSPEGAPGGEEAPPDMPEVKPEEIDPEAVMQAIMELVQSGELDEETAKQVLQALQEEMGGQGGGGAEGAEGAPPDGAGGAAGGPPDDGSKGASVPLSVKRAATLTLELTQAAVA